MLRLARASVIALALSAAACSGDDDSNPTSPSEPPGNTITYSVLGASDGLGIGGSIVCAPLDLGCENGTGYAQTIRRRWVAEGRTVNFRNLSIPGTVLSPAIAEFATSLGRSDPGNMMRAPGFMPAASTHVTVFAGGNDANIIGSAIAAGAAGNDIRGYIDTHVRQWGADLGELIARIRAQAPNARIVAFNLPNLGAAPYMAGRPSLERSMMQRIATGLSDQVNGLTNRGVVVVDLLCDPRTLQPSTYSAADGFHPSDAGYALMADLGFDALTTGSAPTPQPACAGRTALPVF
jgi:lysophospholipase L1-like esterase